MNKEGLYNGVKSPEERIRKYEGKTLRKNHCSIRKNIIRNNHFIQELTPRIPHEMTNSPKNLLLGLKIIVWLCVLSSSDKLLAYINCCKTHHQPNSFTHSLINLLYWAYWAHILFYLGLGYDLWPYTYLGKKKKSNKMISRVEKIEKSTLKIEIFTSFLLWSIWLGDEKVKEWKRKRWWKSGRIEKILVFLICVWLREWNSREM